MLYKSIKIRKFSILKFWLENVKGIGFLGGVCEGVTG
jgi:hypothetical protein